MFGDGTEEGDDVVELSEWLAECLEGMSRAGKNEDLKEALLHGRSRPNLEASKGVRRRRIKQAPNGPGDTLR